MLRAVIMGVSGCGKTSVGEGLAARLGVVYRDGDHLHPPENVARMRAGIPLTDADRWPWLDRVAGVLASAAPVIVGCSALRRAYRDRIRAGAGAPVRFVHLAGSRAIIAARMAARQGHFMPLTLLDSQFAALEPPGPDEALTVDIDQPLPALIDAILLGLAGAKA
jgi:gluconokinase